MSIMCFGEIIHGCVRGITGRHDWDVPLGKALDNTNLFQEYLTTIFIVLGLGLIKLSLFIQYYLLFRPLRYVRISVYIGATILVISYVSFTIAAFVLESPWPGESMLDDAFSTHYIRYEMSSIPCGIVSTLFDCYLLVLPMPAVWNLKTSWGKKLGIMLVFMTGSLATIASAVNLSYRVRFQQGFEDLKPNRLVEMFAGVTASSMPAVRQFFHHHDLSPMSWSRSLRSNLVHLRTGSMRSTRKKVPDDNSSFKDLVKSNRRGSDITDGFRMRDLDRISDEHKGPTASQIADPYIRIQQDITVTTDQLEDP
ncbi:MAG: hypothetical protein Q9165_008007 [Trypethelium subeluteriae]